MSTYSSSLRDSLFTSAIPRKPSHDAESPTAPSNNFSTNSQSYYNYSTLYSTSTTLPFLLYTSTLLNPTHHLVSVPGQAVPHATRSRDQCQDKRSTPSPLSRSNHRDSPPGGRQMEQDKIHLEIEEILRIKKKKKKSSLI